MVEDTIYLTGDKEGARRVPNLAAFEEHKSRVGTALGTLEDAEAAAAADIARRGWYTETLDLTDQEVDSNDYYLGSLDDDMTSIFMSDREEVHAEVQTDLDRAHKEYLKKTEPQKPEATVGRIAGSAWQELKHSPANFAASARSYLENELSRTTDPVSKKNFEELIEKIKEFEESEAFKMAPEFEGPTSGFLEDVARGVTGSLPDIALTIVAPPVGMAAMFAHIQGSSYVGISEQLKTEFPDMPAEQLRKRAYYSSLANAAIQTPFELIGNLIKIKGILGKTGFVKRLIGLAESALGEGFTEFIQQFPDEFATAWALNPDLTPEELKQHLKNIKYDILKRAGYAGAVGAAAGVITTGVGQTAVDVANIMSPKQVEINKERDANIKAKLDAGEKITELDIAPGWYVEEKPPERIIVDGEEIIKQGGKWYNSKGEEVAVPTGEELEIYEGEIEITDAVTLRVKGLHQQQLERNAELEQFVIDPIEEDISDLKEPLLGKEGKVAQEEAAKRIDEQIEKVTNTLLSKGIIVEDVDGDPVLNKFNSEKELEAAEKVLSETRKKVRKRKGISVPSIEESTEKLAELHGMEIEELAIKIPDKMNDAELLHNEVLNIEESHASMKRELADYLSKPSTNILEDATMFSSIARQMLLQGKSLNDATLITKASKMLNVADNKENVMVALEQLQANAKIRGEDKKTLAQVFRAMRSHQINKSLRDMGKVSFFDVAIEYWINGLLSNPATHMVNIVSNTLAAFWMVPERYMGATSSFIRRKVLKIPTKDFDIQNPDSRVDPAHLEIEFGEAHALMYGFFGGLVDVFKLVAESGKTLFVDPIQTIKSVHKLAAESLRDPTIGLERTKLESVGSFKALHANGFNDVFNRDIDLSGNLAVILNLFGAVLRAPGSALIISDKVFRNIIGYRMELKALAYRQASAEGLEGKALGKRIADIVDKPAENGAGHLDKAAREQASYQTFTSKLEGAGRGIESAIQTHKLLKVIVPFFRTPWNIVKFGLSRTPLAAIPYTSTFYADVRAGGARGDLAIARVVGGSAIMIGLGFLAATGAFTGGGPDDSDLRKLKRNQGWQPYSFRWGGTYYSYSRLEPFGIILGMTADFVDVAGELSRGEAEKGAIGLVHAISNNITSKTWLKGASEFINVFNEPERYTERYVIKLMSTLIPFSSGLAQMARVKDPTLQDIRIHERDMKFSSEVFYKWLDVVKSRIPADSLFGLSMSTTPRVNMWGEKIVLGGGLGSAMVSPIYTSEAKSSLIDEELYRLGVEDNRHFTMPRNVIKIHGIDIELTAPEYQIYLTYMNQKNIVEKGRTLKESLNALVKGFNVKGKVYPDEIRHMIISRYFEAARAQAKELLYKDVKSVEDYIIKGTNERAKELNKAKT